MGIYGIDYYGVTRFGRDPDLARPDFSVDPFVSTPIDYATLFLTWVRPQSTDCTQLQLVRNVWNLPQDETDGAILFTDLVSRPTNYTDGLAGPGFNYYSMFGWDSVNNDWVRCSDLIALLPVQWGYSARLYQLLPAAYRDQDAVLVDHYNPWPINTNGQPPLQRFMAMLGFELDFIRTELESLMSVNDAMRCSGAVLPLLEYQFGLPAAPEIGMQQERALVTNAVHLYKYKGSPRGITLFSSVLTGYAMANMVHRGYNLLLCLDDSVMMTSIGTWQKWPPPNTHFTTLAGNNGLTLTQIPNLLTVPNMTNPTKIIGFEPQGPPVYGASGVNPGMRIQGTGAGDYIITTGQIPTIDFLPQAVNSGTTTPLQGNCTWVIQVFSTVARTIEIGVFGDNGAGAEVSLGTVVTGTSTLNDWAQFTFTAPVTGPNPATGVWPYYWLYPRIRIIGAAANEAHYVTLLRLWACESDDIGSYVPVYDYPRDMKLVLQPQTANMLANPLTEFPYGLDGWTPAADPTQPTQNYTTGLYVHYVTEADPTGVYAVSGTAGLIVGPTNASSVLWAGTVTNFDAAPPEPLGWFSDPSNSWFSGATLAPASSRPFYDPDPGTPSTNSWFFLQSPSVTDDQYFGLGQTMLAGNWFYQTQPPLTGNAVAFAAFPAQPLNFSVYARYMTVADPSNAFMDIGFRWYFPDGTWLETFESDLLTSTFDRYDYSAETPTEPITGVSATTVYPFVRWPRTTAANFVLNSAQLSPGPNLLPFLDASLHQGDSDYVIDSYGASYYYKRRTPRTQALTTELYRWLPMGATYTMTFGAGNIQPPLDPTMW